MSVQLTGTMIDYLVVFGAGVAVSFTPCVYPVMPVTASFIGGLNTEGSRWWGFVLSCIYVFGIAMTYCALGVVAALTGQVFGALQNHPAVYWTVAGFFIVFGLALLDVFHLPFIGVDLRHKIKAQNIWTILLFGMASGLAVGACTAPVLGGLLVLIAKGQDVMRGVSLLFVFSYGVGASLILVGTFSGLLANLPKSGVWLVRIKHACGVLLLIIGGYFIGKAGGWIL